jgi:hypothetical protein
VQRRWPMTIINTKSASRKMAENLFSLDSVAGRARQGNVEFIVELKHIAGEDEGSVEFGDTMLEFK